MRLSDSRFGLVVHPACSILLTRCLCMTTIHLRMTSKENHPRKMKKQPHALARNEKKYFAGAKESRGVSKW